MGKKKSLLNQNHTRENGLIGTCEVLEVLFFKISYNIVTMKDKWFQHQIILTPSSLYFPYCLTWFSN